MANKTIITKHAVDRWVERINPDLADDRTLAEEEIRDILNVSTKIYSEKDKGEIVDYYNVGEVIFVLRSKNNSSVLTTVYIPEYGFGKEIDQTLRSLLLQKINELRDSKRQLEISIANELEMLEREITDINRQIEEMESTIQRLKYLKERNISRKKECSKKLELFQTEYESYCRKLVKSLNYNMEMLELNNNHNKKG